MSANTSIYRLASSFYWLEPRVTLFQQACVDFALLNRGQSFSTDRLNTLCEATTVLRAPRKITCRCCATFRTLAAVQSSTFNKKLSKERSSTAAEFSIQNLFQQGRSLSRNEFESGTSGAQGTTSHQAQFSARGPINHRLVGTVEVTDQTTKFEQSICFRTIAR